MYSLEPIISTSFDKPNMNRVMGLGLFIEHFKNVGFVFYLFANKRYK